MLAEYTGAWTWRVAFEPEELGRWTYRWSHDFTNEHHESAEGEFDVVARDRASVLAHIARLRDRAAARDREDGYATKRAMASLMRAERAALALETAQSFAGSSGEEFRAALNELRAAIDEPRPEILELFPESGIAGRREPQASP